MSLNAATAETPTALTFADAANIKTTTSKTLRAELAQSVALGYSKGLYGPAETEIALDIFRQLAKDAETLVRRALSEAVSRIHTLPHDIAWLLARDVAEVAVPMLEFSTVLSEEDLIAITQSTKELLKLQAIARRETLSSPLVDALCATDEPLVIRDVLQNKGAQIQEAMLPTLLKQINRNELLLEALIQRGQLPMTLVERLFSSVSDRLRLVLMERYPLATELVDHAVVDAKEWSTLDTITPQISSQALDAMIADLHARGELTHSFVIRALCIGDLRVFEAAMATLAGISILNARLLMLDPGPLGFKALYEQAHLPESFAEALRVVYNMALEETGFGRFQPADYAKRLVQRLCSEGYDKRLTDMPYLISLMRREPNEAPTIH